MFYYILTRIPLGLPLALRNFASSASHLIPCKTFNQTNTKFTFYKLSVSCCNPNPFSIPLAVTPHASSAALPQQHVTWPTQTVIPIGQWEWLHNRVTPTPNLSRPFLPRTQSALNSTWLLYDWQGEEGSQVQVSLAPPREFSAALLVIASWLVKP